MIGMKTKCIAWLTGFCPGTGEWARASARVCTCGRYNRLGPASQAAHQQEGVTGTGYKLQVLNSNEHCTRTGYDHSPMHRYMHASGNVSAELMAGDKHHGYKMWQIAALLHTVAWWAQIHPGHGIYEGIKPALLDSLGQAFGVAPLFAFLEGIWAVGLAPELRDRVGEQVALRRAEMCANGGAFAFC